mgnify:CR=1 FL=1
MSTELTSPPELNITVAQQPDDMKVQEDEEEHQMHVEEEEDEAEQPYEREGDANVAAIRASQLLFTVLKQCSARLGFASLSPNPLQLQHAHKKRGKKKSSDSIPILFSN